MKQVIHLIIVTEIYCFGERAWQQHSLWPIFRTSHKVAQGPFLGPTTVTIVSIMLKNELARIFVHKGLPSLLTVP